MIRRIVLSVVAGLITFTTVGAKPYEELVPKFDRMKANCMVRKIAVPTLANLDFAAYDANPVLFEPEKFKPKAPEETPALKDITFDGNLSDVVNSLDQTPLTKEEKTHPMAWKPLVKKLWQVAKDQGLKSTSGKIIGYKWADPNIYMPYQDVTTAYLHDNNGTPEIWVKVEFQFWVKFMKNVTDEDDDGIKEIYGKLNIEEVAPEALTASVEWIKNDYIVMTVDRQGVIDWISDLASYWYPTKNSDILDPEETKVWPNKETKDYRRVKKYMKKVTVENPIVVVEAKPFDPARPIYNVYLVEGIEAEKKAKAASAAIENKKMDASVSENFKENNKRFQAELKKHGSYEKWATKNAKYIEAQKSILKNLPDGGAKGVGIEGKDDFVFFSKSLIYTVAGELGEQEKVKNPILNLKEYKAAFDERNVNFLYVVVPTKSEVYHDKLGVESPSDPSAIINPYSRKVLKDLQEAGIEVIDLLPHYLEAKKEDNKSDELLYQKQDTHWTNRGMQIAIDLIVDRIKQYGWYDEAEKHGVEYTIVDTTFSRQGDIVAQLPEEKQTKYPAVVLKAQQVRTPEGKLKKQSIAGPILLMGDSFTGVFERVDCKGAGLVSHLTAKTGRNVGHIISWGGGPLVPERLGKNLDKILASKRLVVYVMVARDLHDYAQGWKTLTPGK